MKESGSEPGSCPRRLAFFRLTPLLALVFALADRALADGTETLGMPSIPIASGTDLVAAGVGLSNLFAGTINVSVPEDASVEQVLLYWIGDENPPANLTDTIQVNGNSVTGAFIGGRDTSAFGRERQFAAYRADIRASVWWVPATAA